MALAVHILSDFDEDWQRRLRSKLDPGITLTVGQETPKACNYRILVAGRPERRHFDDCRSCDTLIVPFAGLPAKICELMRELPHIAVHNLHHNAAPTAELAITLMMAAAKRIVTTDAALRRNDWRSGDMSEEILLEGRTAVILGYGHIGQRIARACESFGMNVIGVRSRAGMTVNGKVSVVAVEQLDDFLPSAEVLFVSLPLTSETEGLLKRRRLSLLPDRAIIVNTARGGIIEEKALYDEIKSERIRAGLDVWYCYPKSKEEHGNCPPSNFPFGKLRNVVMTPHLGGNSDGTEELRVEHLARLINAAARGEPMSNRVDVNAGY